MATIVSQSISDTDMLILQYNIYDENNENNPVTKWIDEALTGKVNNCYKRMKAQWVPILMDDPNVSAISASKDDFVLQVTNRSDYENRYQQASGSSNA
jgi:hypothetical protein